MGPEPRSSACDRPLSAWRCQRAGSRRSALPGPRQKAARRSDPGHEGPPGKAGNLTGHVRSTQSSTANASPAAQRNALTTIPHQSVKVAQTLCRKSRRVADLAELGRDGDRARLPKAIRSGTKALAVAIAVMAQDRAALDSAVIRAWAADSKRTVLIISEPGRPALHQRRRLQAPSVAQHGRAAGKLKRFRRAAARHDALVTRPASAPVAAAMA